MLLVVSAYQCTHVYASEGKHVAVILCRCWGLAWQSALGPSVAIVVGVAVRLGSKAAVVEGQGWGGGTRD